MAGKLPLKRKLEIAFAGYLLDLQAADPTFLPGFAIVCGATGRSPDDQTPVEGAPIEPDLPYLSVGCPTARDRADFPSGYGIKDATLVILTKTHASDEPRADADDREASVADLFEDPATIIAALNQPESAATPDNRRQKALYLFDVGDLEANDDHTDTTWEDELVAKVLCQGFDPDRT